MGGLLPCILNERFSPSKFLQSALVLSKASILEPTALIQSCPKRVQLHFQQVWGLGLDVCWAQGWKNSSKAWFCWVSSGVCTPEYVKDKIWLF